MQLYHDDIEPDLGKVFAILATSKGSLVLIAEKPETNRYSCWKLSFGHQLGRQNRYKQAIVVDEKYQNQGIGKNYCISSPEQRKTIAERSAQE